MRDFERRLLELASDILTAVSQGELPADAPVVRAAGAALGELRRVPVEATPAAAASGPASPSAAAAAGDLEGRTGRGARAAPPVEQVLGVAARMRSGRSSFAAACAAEAEALGTSAQAVRNACTRWLGVAASEWQPLVIAGAEAGVVPLARRVAERCPWLVERIAETFGVPRALVATGGGEAAPAGG